MPPQVLISTTSLPVDQNRRHQIAVVIFSRQPPFKSISSASNRNLCSQSLALAKGGEYFTCFLILTLTLVYRDFVWWLFNS